MTNLTIGVMSPGDMGHSVAAVLVEKGHRVVTVSAGRSELTRTRAERANMEDVADLAAMVARLRWHRSVLPMT